MGLFTLRKRAPTVASPIMNHTSTSSTTTLVPSPLPISKGSSTFGRSSKVPSPIAFSPASPEIAPISLRVAIDPLPLNGANQEAKELFYVNVSPEEGIAALRREIARTLGHSSMGLFKVSIPWQAHYQSRAYTERYDKPVDLLASFPAFNLDDASQLALSLESAWKSTAEEALATGDLKIKHWFPNHISGQSDVISIIARPLQGMSINTVPLTLRAYFSTPSSRKSGMASASSSSRARPSPLVIDVDPYITVNELKSELLRASGRDASLWQFVVLWQIAMTDSEMNVIDELGRLKGGKMPWPYPPGAMEPIAMTDGNLPVSLFFPRSAPNGDMLNLSVWLNPKAGSAMNVVDQQEIPPFRYPMAFANEQTSFDSPTSSQTPLTPITPAVDLPQRLLKSKSKASRGRPSTAPAAITKSDSEAQTPRPPAFGSRSTAPPPLPQRPTHAYSVNRTPQGLGIVTFPSNDTANLPSAPHIDRCSFSSTLSASEDEESVPSLNFSQLSINTPESCLNVKTPEVERQDWLLPDHLLQGERMGGGASSGLRKTPSVIKGGSLSSRVRRAAAGRASPLLTYSPCKTCSPSEGFQSCEEFTGVDSNGTDSGMVTFSNEAKVELKCTGTGIDFDLTYGQPNSSSFTTTLSINGTVHNTTTPSSSTTSTSVSATRLPQGQHSFQLSFHSNTTSTAPDQSDWVRLNGARCILGTIESGGTKNVTIDDTAWRQWDVILTPGWNMLERDSSNWINTTQYDAELPTAERDYNGSISWTEQADAGNTIYFHGSAAWVYGIVGGEAGSYEVVLDNVTQGVFNASGGSRVYNQVLYHASNLADTNHNISLRNIEQGKRLSFDRLVALSNLSIAPTPLPVVTISSTSDPTSTFHSPSMSHSATATAIAAGKVSASSSGGLSSGAIAGIVIAVVVVILGILGWLVFAWRKRSRRRHDDVVEGSGMREKPDPPPLSRWSIWSNMTTTSSIASPHPFRRLPEPSPISPINFASSSPTTPITPSTAGTQRSFLKIGGAGAGAGQKTTHALGGGNAHEGYRSKKPSISNPIPIKQEADFTPTLEGVNEAEFELPIKTVPQSDRANAPTRPNFSRRISEISPLAAALSGHTSSPLAALTQNPSITTTSQASNAEDGTKPRFGSRGGMFGRRKGGLNNSLDTGKTSFFSSSSPSDDDNGGGQRSSTPDRILSIYSTYSPRFGSSHIPIDQSSRQQDRFSKDSRINGSGEGVDDGMLGLELGDDQLKPPSRRFFGKAFGSG
ncbi:hypothetical protein CI109_105139 [Kwoniella shandongensis]|uniref:Uncharacterized protein n=1 Tax=Kwoniella shandongensis TaxID=1734106 RepID=A0A5M6C3M8_9TREE|nr:uncharacterized protein CI109_001978 [Kwoniella shandongensis]KAA5529553.1 hypothetical protein CI109_001978 [Kwoniella shandongensis]